MLVEELAEEVKLINVEKKNNMDKKLHNRYSPKQNTPKNIKRKHKDMVKEKWPRRNKP